MNYFKDVFKGGIEYTSEIFVIDKIIYFRRIDTIWRKRSEVINGGIVTMYFNTYFAYDLQIKYTKQQITAKTYYEKLKLYQLKGINKEDEDYLYEHALDNSFIMFMLFNSIYL